MAGRPLPKCTRDQKNDIVDNAASALGTTVNSCTPSCVIKKKKKKNQFPAKINKKAGKSRHIHVYGLEKMQQYPDPVVEVLKKRVDELEELQRDRSYKST